MSHSYRLFHDCYNFWIVTSSLEVTAGFRRVPPTLLALADEVSE